MADADKPRLHPLQAETRRKGAWVFSMSKSQPCLLHLRVGEGKEVGDAKPHAKNPSSVEKPGFQEPLSMDIHIL